MSVANVVFAPDRILCTSDTLHYAHGQPHSLCERKTIIARSGAFAWVGRGSVMVGDVYNRILSDCPSFDEAAHFLASDMTGLKNIAIPPFSFEIHLMGWSVICGALSVVRLSHHPDHPLELMVLPPGVYLHPYASSAAPPDTLTDRQLIKVTLGQQAYARRLNLPLCIGGLVHLTTVGKDGIAQTIAATYPDYAQDAARFGCPNQRREVA